ncbi:MAG: dynamin family protein [Oscillospiraceae bacterium]|nr:dynamin family protein [Oscillospiraceae bacterium]
MDNYNVIESFKEYQKNQNELAKILANASEITCELNMSKEKELAELSTRVGNDTFKIMVTGTFKNGKSTFINALLGEEILPAYALPCTAVINEVKYGTKKKAILYFRNPLPNPLPEKLAEKAVSHMRKYQNKPIPPLEIPYDEIEDYVVIPMGADEKQIKLQSPYEKVELFYPLELLKNGVEIIDSPGLNEDETRTKVTMDYLNKVDAILYVLNANAICAGDEMKFVENDLKGNSFDSVFFVVNKFDQIRSREQPQIRQYAESKLKKIYQQPEVFCISALDALDGRLDNDADLIERSGMDSLEKRLTDFLTKEKGKAKLASPAKQVRRILSREALEIVIPKERALLDRSLDDIKNKYAKIQPRLVAAQKEKDQVAAEMETKIERAGTHFERLAKSQISAVIRSINTWVDEFNPETSLGFIPGKSQTEKAAVEIIDYLKGKISEDQNDWRNNVLIPEIEEAANNILGDAEKDISKIHRDIDSINIELIGNDYNADSVPLWQRVAGVAGGLLVGDIGLAVSGGVNGIGKELAMTAAFEFGAGVVLSMLGLLNPITGILIVGIAAIANISQGQSRVLENLKAKIKEEAINNMSNMADDHANALADGVKRKMGEIKEGIIESLSNELKDIEKQLQNVIEEKKKGEKEVAARKIFLNNSEEKIHELNSELDTLIFTLVGA